MTHVWVESEVITVQVGADDQPVSIRWGGYVHRLEQIVQSWEIHTGWWESEGSIWRAYYAAITVDGMFCVFYHDLTADTWRLAKIYD